MKSERCDARLGTPASRWWKRGCEREPNHEGKHRLTFAKGWPPLEW